MQKGRKQIFFFLTSFLIHLLVYIWSPRECCALSWQVPEWEQCSNSVWQDCTASPVQGLEGQEWWAQLFLHLGPKIQQSYPQRGVLCADQSMHWLQYLAVKEYSCRCCCTADQAFCWAAFKYTKYKCIITFQPNLFAGLAFNIMRNLNYGGPCKFHLEQFSLTLNGKGEGTLWSGARWRAISRLNFKTVLWQQGCFFKWKKNITQWLERWGEVVLPWDIFLLLLGKTEYT